jgi:hypothetical protein
MLRRSNLVPLATAAALSLTLAACGGGGGASSSSKSVLPVATSTAPARTPDAKATLTLKFPAHTARVRVAGATAAMKRSPAYINPNGASLVVTAFGQTLLDSTNGNAIYFSLGTQDPTTGISTVNIPLLSGNYNTGDLTITEYDGNGGGDVLAYGYNASYTDGNGNFNNGTFTLAPGGSASPVLTMVMNAAGIALTSDPVAGSDAIALAANAPGANTCGSNFHNGVTLYAFAIDASGTMVLPGQTPGAGLTGQDPNSSFPGVNAATLSNQFPDSGNTHLTSTIFGPGVLQLNDPTGNGQMQATFNTQNPLSQISNPFFPPSNITGWVELGGGWC